MRLRKDLVDPAYEEQGGRVVCATKAGDRICTRYRGSPIAGPSTPKSVHDGRGLPIGANKRRDMRKGPLRVKLLSASQKGMRLPVPPSTHDGDNR